MITDIMDVHNAFCARFDGKFIRGAAVPVMFYNAQPKLKSVPKYPSLIITAFIPKFGDFHWVGETETPDTVAGTVTIQPPPKDLYCMYQVDGRADRFDDATTLFGLLTNAIEEDHGMNYLTIGNDTFQCNVVDTKEMPDIDMGTFQWSFTYRVRLPYFNVTPQVLRMISTVDFNIDSTFDPTI